MTTEIKDQKEVLGLLQTATEYNCDNCYGILEALVVEDEIHDFENLSTGVISQIFNCCDVIPLVCRRCNIYFGACVYCSGIYEKKDEYFGWNELETDDYKDLQFCQFMGCEGYTDNGMILRPNSTWSSNASHDEYHKVECTIISVYEDEPPIPYYVGDKNLFHLDPNKDIENGVCITGPCGGELHYWRCPRCCITFSCTNL